MENETFEVTSDRPGFAPVPQRLIGDERIDNPTTLVVYVALASFANSDADCYPSYVKLAERARVDDRTARRHIKLLAELGYVRVDSGKVKGVSNTYHLVDPWGRTGSQGGWDTRVLPGRTPVSYKLDPDNKRGGGEAPAGGPPSPQLEPNPPSILSEVKKECQARGIGWTWCSPGWEARFGKFLAQEGVREGDILPAFRTCLELGGNPHYFVADFPKWLGKTVSTAKTVKVAPPNPQHFCPRCKQPVRVVGDEARCLPCHALLLLRDGKLIPEAIEGADEAIATLRTARTRLKAS